MTKATKQANQNSQKAPLTGEIFRVDATIDQVVCDGGGGPLGHPQVWYNFDGKDVVACHYCGRKFVKTPTE